ncbi:hypothetical protein MHI04_07215 [Lysinibacillus sp. FSL K6-1151]|uniref:hypothetical protein n=1 Tax=Lysinibacillus sp. FSL K6-1151 TaxID=2921465 RepID=UPI003159AA6A
MKLEELLYFLSEAKSPSDIVITWGIRESKDTSKAIISLENYENDFLPKEFINVVFSEDNDFYPYFQTKNLFFIDNKILKNMLSSSRDIKIPIDYSVMFDTNYASYIHQFVNDDMSNLNNEVFTSIAILLRENFQYDYHFYLIENSKSINFDENFDINYFKKMHNDLYQNIASLELFKSIDSELFKKEGKIKYTITPNEAENNAEELIKMLFCNELGRDFLKDITFMQKQLTLFLIGVLIINFSSKRNAQKKILELFNFMNEKVGIYFERETIVAYKYFKEPGSLKIFRQIQKKMDTSKLLDIINNISWDFTAPRIMEFFMRVGGEGKFFIPFFLTHDGGLKDVIKLFTVKGVLFEDLYGSIPISSINTQHYFETEKCNVDFDFFFSMENKSQRATRVDKNREVIDEIIIEEINKFINIITN